MEVTFKSDKPGIFYYGTRLDYESKPALEWVFANGETSPLLAGDNHLILNNVPADHERFYWIAVDEKGNCRVYVDSTAIKKAAALSTDSNQGGYADLSAKPDLAKEAVLPETSLPETTDVSSTITTDDTPPESSL